RARLDAGQSGRAIVEHRETDGSPSVRVVRGPSAVVHRSPGRILGDHDPQTRDRLPKEAKWNSEATPRSSSSGVAARGADEHRGELLSCGREQDGNRLRTRRIRLNTEDDAWRANAT